MGEWEVVVKAAYNEDGSLFFPEKLTHAFLERQKRDQGSYIFSSQYLNEIVPSDLQTFKKEWIQYYQAVPTNVRNFIFVDPAISQADTADFTGVVCVAVDPERRWFVRYAKRFKITPTQLITLLFELNRQFKPQSIGIEEVAYQKALLYFIDEEMRRRDVMLPIVGIRPPSDKTKEMRILSLVPRMEWGHVFLNQGLTDLELEMAAFPRGAHDDLIDALAGIEYIASYPVVEPEFKVKPSPNDPKYEKWFIQNLRKGQNEEQQD